MALIRVEVCQAKPQPWPVRQDGKLVFWDRFEVERVFVLQAPDEQSASDIIGTLLKCQGRENYGALHADTLP